MAEQVTVAVPYPVVGLIGAVLAWGPVCPVHPAYMGSNVPTDAERRTAEAFAVACACAHPDHSAPDVPDAVVNAAIVAAMREHTYDARWADRDWYQHHDMTPVVHRAESLGEVNRWGDSWVVEVQYSSKGGRAVYGVNRNHIPSCYMD